MSNSVEDVYNALIEAIKDDELDTVLKIIQTKEGKRALIHADKHGETPVYLAAYEDRSEMIEAMLATEEGKQALLMKNSNGDTPLLIAVDARNLSTVEKILKAEEGKKTILIPNSYKEYPLTLAVKGFDEEITLAIQAVMMEMIQPPKAIALSESSAEGLDRQRGRPSF